MRSDRKEVSDPLHLYRLESWLVERASSPYGRELLQQQSCAHGLELERRFEAAQTWAALVERDHPPALYLENDCRPALAHLQRNGELDGLQLRDVKALTQVLCDLRVKETASPASVSGLTCALGDYEDILLRLAASIGPNGDLLDGASAELGSLRARRESARRRHTQLADQLRDELHTDGHLSDRYVTQRDDRHVLPVKASAKRQFGGVVHDSSRSGKTAYVEPARLIEAGANVRQAEDAVQAEERRILKRLSQIISDKASELDQDIGVLATLDADRTRGVFSREYQGVVPTFDDTQIKLRNIRSPALLLAGVDPVVPIDIDIEKPVQVLIISGPNGGGKSVALTACAWAFELAQRGIPIPASQVTLPQPPYTVCAVVGDAADDRQAHSTFSGHLDALQTALDAAQNDHALVVIDEIANGTEPIAGSAIACGFLETFAERQAFVVTTTHYDPVKQLGLSHERMRSAAVRDRRDPAEAFQVFADEVGGSHPIKLAIDLGLPDEVIARARQHLDPERRTRLDELKKQQLETSRLEQLRRQLDVEKEALNQQLSALEAERERLAVRETKRLKQFETAKLRLDKLRTEELAKVDELRQQLSDTVKDLRQQSSEQAAKSGDRLFSQVKALRNRTEDLRLEEQSRPHQNDIEVGDTVRLFAGGNTGIVQEFRGKQALVLIDGKIFHLHTDQLQRASTSIGKTKKGKHKRASMGHTKTTLAVTEASAPKLDLRGLRVHEAEARIDRFLQHLCDVDRAGRIIHGVGTGALRQTTHDYLKNGPWTVQFRGGLSAEGADGVTVVRVEG